MKKWLGSLGTILLLLEGAATSSAQSYVNTVLSDDPSGFWQLNGNANDSSGFGHNGTINGGVTFEGSGRAQGTGSNGVLFTGGNITIPSISSWSTSVPNDNSMSIELWYMETSHPGGSSDFISTGGDRTDGTWQMFDAVGGQQPGFEDFAPFASDTGGGSVFLTGTNGTLPNETIPAVGVWHQLVATISGDEIAIYLDGQLSLENSLYDPRTPDLSASALTLGEMGDLNLYNYSRSMSDVSTYDYALSAGQIQTQYDAATAHAPAAMIPFAIGLLRRRRSK